MNCCKDTSYTYAMYPSLLWIAYAVGAFGLSMISKFDGGICTFSKNFVWFIWDFGSRSILKLIASKYRKVVSAAFLSYKQFGLKTFKTLTRTIKVERNVRWQLVLCNHFPAKENRRVKHNTYLLNMYSKFSCISFCITILVSTSISIIIVKLSIVYTTDTKQSIIQTRNVCFRDKRLWYKYYDVSVALK